MKERRATPRTALPREIPTATPGARNLPAVLEPLAATLAQVYAHIGSSGTESLTGSGLQVRTGMLRVTRCLECELPVLPDLDESSWLSNRLFAQQMDERTDLLVFLELGTLPSAPVAAKPAPAGRLLRSLRTGIDALHQAVPFLADVDTEGRWLALAGWHYSGPHYHLKRATAVRESFCNQDSSQGVRFSFSTASAFLKVSAKPGIFLVAELPDIILPTSPEIAVNLP